ncbi:MAG: hypothetical protein ACLUW6_06000 [Coriobacteriaceae bacterium]
MSGHPSFIPKAGGSRRSPGGHGHRRPRRPWPGGPHDGRREGAGLQPHQRMLAFMGQFKGSFCSCSCSPSTAFSIVGPKVLSEATTVLFDGAVAPQPAPARSISSAIGRILLATLALYLLSAACSWVRVLGHELISQQTCYRLRDAIRKDRPRALGISRRPPRATPSPASPTMWTRWARASTRASPRPSPRRSRWWACLS